MPEIKALVVDDSKVVRKVLMRAITLSGVEIANTREAKNGLEALSVLQTEPIDVLLTDLHMPKMTGVELLDELGRRGLRDELMIVVISSDSTASREAEVRGKGASAFIRKPFQPEQIRAVLEQVMA